MNNTSWSKTLTINALKTFIKYNSKNKYKS